MNAKKLIIAFLTVSVAALVFSAFAVFAVARTYSQRLSETRETSASAPETTSAPKETEALPTVNNHPETEQATETEEVTEAPETTLPEETVSPFSGFLLTFSDGRLIITSPEGETVYERIIESGDIRENDKKLLLKGIEFDDIESAKSAIYDIIS